MVEHKDMRSIELNMAAKSLLSKKRYYEIEAKLNWMCTFKGTLLFLSAVSYIKFTLTTD